MKYTDLFKGGNPLPERPLPFDAEKAEEEFKELLNKYMVEYGYRKVNAPFVKEIIEKL